MEGATMNASTDDPAGPGDVPERRQTPDRRIPHSILNQEALARIVAEERGADSYAGRALAEYERRCATASGAGSGEDELIVYSLRGQWLVGPVKEIRRAVLDAAAAACRRHSTRPESGSEPRQRDPHDSTQRGVGR